MTFFETQWTALVRHPSSESKAISGVDVRVRGQAPDSLTFQYVLRGEMAHVRIPPTQRPGRADDLWKTTCFEAFIADKVASGYYELNFSPSRQWAMYRFSAYREGMSTADVTHPPELQVRRFDNRLEVDAIVRLSDLSAVQVARTLKLALTAVAADDSGTLSYWALKHGPGKPDFHYQDGFVLELPT